MANPPNTTIVQGTLFLSDNTAKVFFQLRDNVHRIAGFHIRITEPWGAGRTIEQQRYLYQGWINRRPGFNMAAPPGSSNHEAPYTAFDLVNWRQNIPVIEREARALGLRRDPSEGWHWNYMGAPYGPGSGGTPGAQPGTPTPTPDVFRKRDMEIVRRTSTGDTYALGAEFVKHLNNAEMTNAAAKVLYPDDRAIDVNDTEFGYLVDAFAVRRDMVYNAFGSSVPFGFTWSKDHDTQERLRESSERMSAILEALNG